MREEPGKRLVSESQKGYVPPRGLGRTAQQAGLEGQAVWEEGPPWARLVERMATGRMGTWEGSASGKPWPGRYGPWSNGHQKARP